jgi:hypothetical protein
MEGEFKVTGFNTRQELLEYQVKEYQAFMREQTAKIEELNEKLKEAVEALEFYSKTESWDADGWIANADLHEPWGDQGISLGGKRARAALEAIKSK